MTSIDHMVVLNVFVRTAKSSGLLRETKCLCSFFNGIWICAMCKHDWGSVLQSLWDSIGIDFPQRGCLLICFILCVCCSLVVNSCCLCETWIIVIPLKYFFSIMHRCGWNKSTLTSRGLVNLKKQYLRLVLGYQVGRFSPQLTETWFIAKGKRWPVVHCIR